MDESAWDPTNVVAPDAEVVLIPVDSVSTDQQVRVAGVNEDHVAALSETPDDLPPIVVNRRSMQVVDGAHRLRAARERGAQSIRAVLVDGDDVSTFVLAVRLNAQHGLPLSRRDRAAAVDRLLVSFPHWSDRRVAVIAGVAHTTVATRRRSTGRTHQSTVGRDGRVRPRDSSPARRRAERMVTERPDASIREIARSVGVSPATVLDVRRRGAGERPAVLPTTPAGRGDGPVAAAHPAADGAAQEAVRALESLRSDPSLRYSTTGRMLLRLLSLTLSLRDVTQLLSAVPAHSRATLAQLARRNAEQWSRTAAELEAMDRQDTPRATGR